MPDLEAGADKGAIGLQEVDASENQELNITVTEPEDQLPMQASGDQTKAIASALAEAFSSTLSPLLKSYNRISSYWRKRKRVNYF